MPSNQAAPNGLVSAISIPMSNPLENMRNWSYEHKPTNTSALRAVVSSFCGQSPCIWKQPSTAGEQNQNVNSSSVTDSASRSNSSNGNSSNSYEDRTGNNKDKENRRSSKVGAKLPLHQGGSAYSPSTEAQKRVSDALNRNVQRYNAHLECSPQHKDDVTGAAFL